MQAYHLYSLLLLVSISCVVAERGTVSGTFTDTASYSFLQDLETSHEGYECGFPWAKLDKNASCTCGDTIHGSVYCYINSSDPRSTKVGILDCSCMTWDEDHNTTVVGHCFHNCENGSTSNRNRINRVYHPINSVHKYSKPENLSEEVCGYLNRRGRLCGACKENYYTPAYSYELKCIKCTYEWFNLVRFIAEAFGPLTVFLFVILLFKISATSARYSTYVLFCQNLTIPSSVQVILRATEGHWFVSGLSKLFITLYSVWNLDFFRSIYPPLCLPVTPMQLMLLEYSIAFYPLLLLFLIYLVVRLHIFQIRGLRCPWIPIRATMNSVTKVLNFKTKLIHMFATFFLLSYSKLLSLSFHLLMYTNIHDPHGRNRGKYLYSDPSLQYFGKEHAFYGVFSLLVFVIFVAMPVILMFFYPMMWFQRLLTRLHLNHELIRSFMESFQGCYKDGTNNTRDCRYFSAMYLVLRILLFVLYSITLTSLFYTFATILFIVMAIIIITVRPYKERYAVYNKVDAIMILVQALSASSVLCNIFANIKGERFKTFSMFLVALFAMLPLLYVLFFSAYWAYQNKGLRRLAAQIKSRLIEQSLRSGRLEKEELLENSRNSYGSINN